MTEARLAHELWQVIQGEDWVLTANTLKEWVHKVWDFDKPYRHVGRELGTGTQIGISIGVALAHKGTGKLVIDLQPDGDLMFDLGALWTPIKYNIPMLIVMYNNRAYYNDWAHQIHMAHQRGTDPARAYIGMDLEGPPPDFAHIAKGIGWYAEGAIEDPAEIGPAVKPIQGNMFMKNPGSPGTSPRIGFQSSVPLTMAGQTRSSRTEARAGTTC